MIRNFLSQISFLLKRIVFPYGLQILRKASKHKMELAKCSLLLLLGFFVANIVPFSSTEQPPSSQLPTVYEYFRNSGENVTGLVTVDYGFKLNGKPIRIVSGSMHYWRVHPALWRDRMKKLRAMGANTLETYVAWNLHEPEMGKFDFGDGDNDMSMFLDIKKYIQMAQEEDLLVILRPGPYICAEVDLGGLPSWLLRDPDMQIRTNYPPYIKRVQIFFDKLLPLMADLQFTRGGPIIAFQIDNEYGFWSIGSKDHLEYLYSLLDSYGIAKESLLFTADPPINGAVGTLPDKLLMTGNFQGYVDENLEILDKHQPRKPKMLMEFWTGWMSQWFEPFKAAGVGAIIDSLDHVFRKWNGSVNFYMFHGGTNFGFTAGVHNLMGSITALYGPVTTSYDYGAPLSESGDYTPKYKLIKPMIEMYQVPKIRQMEMPPESEKTAYPTIKVQEYLSYDDIIAQVPPTSRFKMHKPTSMERLPMNGDSGQSYGYVVYRKVTEISHQDRVFAGPIFDFGMILVDSKLQATGYHQANYWINEAKEFSLNVPVTGSGRHTLDLFVENMGRPAFIKIWNHNNLLKGLVNSTYRLTGDDITDVEVISLEFKSKWVQNLTGWKPVNGHPHTGAPILVKSTFEISKPTDTWLDMSDWHKGIVFVNGFNIGRYVKAGPQQSLYVPGPLLKTGKNTIIIFEQLEPSNQIEFSDQPNLGQVQQGRDLWKMFKLEDCPPDVENCPIKIDFEVSNKFDL